VVGAVGGGCRDPSAARTWRGDGVRRWIAAIVVVFGEAWSKLQPRTLRRLVAPQLSVLSSPRSDADALCAAGASAVDHTAPLRVPAAPPRWSISRQVLASEHQPIGGKVADMKEERMRALQGDTRCRGGRRRWLDIRRCRTAAARLQLLRHDFSITLSQTRWTAVVERGRPRTALEHAPCSLRCSYRAGSVPARRLPPSFRHHRSHCR